MGKKITLAQAIYQGDRIVLIYCEANVGLGWCHHSGEVRLIEMIVSFGPRTRLDNIPARCTRCGRSDRVEVRARPFTEWADTPQRRSTRATACPTATNISGGSETVRVKEENAAWTMSPAG